MTHDDSAALLGPDGPFAREVPHFAPRAAQQAMAAAVEEALANSGRASTLNINWSDIRPAGHSNC